MAGIVRNKAQFFKELDAAKDQHVERFRTRIRLLMSEGLRRMIARTPVHTGEAVMSYMASTGTPAKAHSRGYDPVEATNQLSLGSEQLRADAAEVAMATLAAVNTSDPFQVYYIANNAPHISDIEHGLPPAPGLNARSAPAAPFRVTTAELLEMLRSGKI